MCAHPPSKNVCSGRYALSRQAGARAPPISGSPLWLFSLAAEETTRHRVGTYNVCLNSMRPHGLGHRHRPNVQGCSTRHAQTGGLGTGTWVRPRGYTTSCESRIPSLCRPGTRLTLESPHNTAHTTEPQPHHLVQPLATGLCDWVGTHFFPQGHSTNSRHITCTPGRVLSGAVGVWSRSTSEPPGG